MILLSDRANQSQRLRPTLIVGMAAWVITVVGVLGMGGFFAMHG